MRSVISDSVRGLMFILGQKVDVFLLTRIVMLYVIKTIIRRAFRFLSGCANDYTT